MYLCQPSYRINTRIYDCLLNYRDKTYTYLLNLMNKFSLSIWFLDDGFRSDSNWQLCVAEYTQEDIYNALEIFKTKFNIIGKQEKDLRYLRFTADSSRIIDKIILKNIPNNLDVIQNKIINNNIHESQKFLYVNYNNENVKFHELCKELNLNYKHAWVKINNGFTIDEIIAIQAVNI
jgi:hypothetical protein